MRRRGLIAALGLTWGLFSAGLALGTDEAADAKRTDGRKTCPKILFEAYSGLDTGVDELPREPRWLPRGSAVKVRARKKLREDGIRTKILAVIGGAVTPGPDWEPSVQSVSLALRNALHLAAGEGHDKVALGFLARGYFLKMMTASKLELGGAIVETLAATLPELGMKAALVLQGGAEAYYFRRLLDEAKVTDVEIVFGSLHKSKTHGASAIIEGVGMELGAAEGGD